MFCLSWLVDVGHTRFGENSYVAKKSSSYAEANIKEKQA